MKFVIATKDYAGLGIAIRLKDAGRVTDPERRRLFDLVGQGLVDKQPLDQLVAKREPMRDWYWIWDFNHTVETNELLRAEGCQVFGGGQFANSMEHDRQLASTYRLESPPSYRFSETVEAIRFWKQNACGNRWRNCTRPIRNSSSPDLGCELYRSP